MKHRRNRRIANPRTRIGPRAAKRATRRGDTAAAATAGPRRRRGGARSTAAADVPHAVIVGGSSTEVSALLDEALGRLGFWQALARRAAASERPPAELRVVIKPDLSGFSEASPTATDPRLVEALVDLLHDRGYETVLVVASADSSALWAENRDVLSLAELLGYRFATPHGRPYEIVDLSDDLVECPFPPGTALAGTRIARAWMDADARVLIPKNRTDESHFYALALDALLGVLPCVDKDYHYRHRREAGDVVAALLAIAPPELVLIDALRSAHGSGGLRSPVAIDTGVLIAATDPVVADWVGALKMGLDPWVSPTFRRVAERLPPPPNPRVDGDATPYVGWRNVQPMLAFAAGLRERWVETSRLLRPWLQSLDPVFFPLKEPVDARMNTALASTLSGIDDNPAARWLLLLSSWGIAAAGQWRDAWNVLYDKDALRRVDVPLGIDVSLVDRQAYEASVSGLLELGALLERVPRDRNGICWMDYQESVLFEGTRVIPVPYSEFVAHVDVSRTIQFMNDYIGGVAVPVAWDAEGRVTHQAERNVYLPQPNYLAWWQGRPIDVTKLEFCDYGVDARRMFWKTIRSENDSARFDDGIVTFAAHPNGTRVTILARQLFTLPPVWQALRMELAPEMRSLLVSQAYITFFRRTVNNLEALCEGRDIRIGQPWHEPTEGAPVEPLPVERLARALESWGVGTLPGPPSRAPGTAETAPGPGRVKGDALGRIDGDGFAHFSAGDAEADGGTDLTSTLAAGVQEVLAFCGRLIQAVGADIAHVESGAEGDP